jgi:hypothetical protein
MNPGFSDFRKDVKQKHVAMLMKKVVHVKVILWKSEKKNIINNEDVFYLFLRAFLFTIKAI